MPAKATAVAHGEPRALELFTEQHHRILCRTDRMFAWLMLSQWLAGIILAVTVSPRAWAGVVSHIHPHVWAAVFLGGTIAILPVGLAFCCPGKVLTRHTIAAGQMLASALLIHLTGGRIETHFHVFGSLAFLAFYRDWRVLVTATIVVALDHFLRGLFWPESVFGVLSSSPWRWIEHAAWVLFENSFLIASIRESLSEMRGVAERQAALEAINRDVERQVNERTADLTQEIAERKKAEAELDLIHKRLLETSRQAGMAEVATGVLHNVGNVLNSVNVSASMISDQLKQSKIDMFSRVLAAVRESGGDLAAFLRNDPRGAQLPVLLNQIAEHLVAEQDALLKETESLQRSIEHIKDIVAMQQSYARVAGVTEQIRVEDLIQDVLRMNDTALERHGVRVAQDLAPSLPELITDKHKVLQILVNLVRNAKLACVESGQPAKEIILRARNGGAQLKISVIDNGVGIPPENLTKIFSHGFTTRKNGHGFGLHSGALAAKELGGSLVAFSEGSGRGAAFTLELPLQPVESNP